MGAKVCRTAKRIYKDTKYKNTTVWQIAKYKKTSPQDASKYTQQKMRTQRIMIHRKSVSTARSEDNYKI